MAGRPITLEYWLGAVERRRKELWEQEAVRPLSTDPGFSVATLKRWQREFDRRLGLLRAAESRVSTLQQPPPAAGKQLTYWREQVVQREKALADFIESVQAGGPLHDSASQKRFADAQHRMNARITTAMHKVEQWELRAKARANGAGLRRVT